MRIFFICFTLFLLSLELSVAQSDTTVLVNYISKNLLREIPDAEQMKEYQDSLTNVFSEELLTGYIYSNLHEILPNQNFTCSINRSLPKELKTDSKGRFYVLYTSGLNQVQITINHPEFEGYDSIFQMANSEFEYIPVKLRAKHQINLRGRVYVGNLPVEGVDIVIKHDSLQYNLKTLGCYTDAENYWNCFYLGMFSQNIVFDNPSDSVEIILSKEGYKPQVQQMKIGTYNGQVSDFKLQYTDCLKRFPQHNAGLEIGHSFQKTWGVGFHYLYQFRRQNFNRFGVGISGTLILDQVQTQHATFNNLPLAEPEEYYSIFMAGPFVNFSLTAPCKRKFNVYTGVALPYIFDQNKFTWQPYIATKYYLDLNKAVYLKINYLQYALKVKYYEFNPFGNAVLKEENESFQKMLFNLGLLVSF